ncbi:hypothetical protein NC651_015058 [Populus alba x Populus x berolinensis]|nr:hypothetical protein NC651_015058 [Populus alba x Populus x berolinensis]
MRWVKMPRTQASLGYQPAAKARLMSPFCALGSISDIKGCRLCTMAKRCNDAPFLSSNRLSFDYCSKPLNARQMGSVSPVLTLRFLYTRQLPVRIFQRLSAIKSPFLFPVLVHFCFCGS